MSLVVDRLRRQRISFRAITAWLVALVYLFPVYWMVNTSLKDGSEVFSRQPSFVPTKLDFEPYRSALSDQYGIVPAFINSAIIATSVLVLTLLIAIPASYAAARFRDRVSTTMLVLLTVVQLLPAIAISVPLFVMFRQVGLVNTYIAVIIADIAVTLPFAVILLRPFFKLFPYEVEEAARIDGLSPIAVIVRVVLPTIRPGIIMVSSFAFLMAWGEFTFALNLTTDQAIQPVTVALNRLLGQYGTKWNDLMAVASLISAPVLLLFILLQRFIVAGLAAGATKG